MGVVFEARDTVLERNVAIKLLPRSVASQPAALERFLREARAAAKLHHPHVVGVYDADQFNGQYYIVLELVRGGSLQEVLKTGPLPWVEASRVLADACRGLEVAHRAGLVHRDIKPSNLMRSEDGTVKLSDFGLARPNEPTGATMTGSGSVLGTPQFMSPEQCRSERADERSDLYAMGATYYALLTGQPPYPGDAPLLVMNAHLLDPIPDPRDVDASIPEACSAIIRRTMAKDPDDRYASAAELFADLEETLTRTEVAAEDTDVSQSSRLRRSTTAMSEMPTEPGTLLELMASRPDRSPRKAQSLQRWMAWSLVIAVVLSVGVWKFMTTTQADLSAHPSQASTNNSVLNAPAKRTADDRATNEPSPVAAMSPEAFRLPGMKRESTSSSQHEVWTLDVPQISRVYLANTGEFLVVLTNTTAQPGSGAWQSQVTVWGRDGAKLVEESVRGRASSAAISADSTRLAVGTTGGQGVLLWDTASWRREPSVVPPTPDYVEAVALSADGRWLAYSTTKSAKDGEWVLWNLAERKESRRQNVPGSGMLRLIEFAPDDDLLVVTGSNDGIVRHWTGTQAEPAAQTFDAGQPITAMSYRPAGHLHAIGAGKWFALWDSQRNVRTFVTDPLPVHVWDVAFSPNGQQVCVASGALIQILDADTGREIERLTGFGARALSMAYTPGGEMLFTASADGKLKLWRLTP